jgi:hypothetical protein
VSRFGIVQFALTPFRDPLIECSLYAVGSGLQGGVHDARAGGKNLPCFVLSPWPSPLSGGYSLAVFKLNPANTLAPDCAAVVRFVGTGFCVTGMESDAAFTNLKFAASHKIPLHFNTHLGGFVPKF